MVQEKSRTKHTRKHSSLRNERCVQKGPYAVGEVNLNLHAQRVQE
jgi:hypothetical protein